MKTDRRTFLKVSSAAPLAAAMPEPEAAPRERVKWPRRFTGRQLQQIAFPLGGVAAGSLSLGGRGQLRDWEIFNRPDKGNQPGYAVASIWARVGQRPPVARIAEARYLPPYEGPSGLGSANSPGLPRLASAAFTGAYPMARIDFTDRQLPVKLSLEAFTPIIPLDAEASGLPATVLRYSVTNPAAEAAEVAVCFSIENPVGTGKGRENRPLSSGRLRGLKMSDPTLDAKHELKGDFTLAALDGGEIGIWRGWPRGRWWNSPMLYWDQFSAEGRLGAEPAEMGPVGAVCIRRTIPAGAKADFTFVLAWHFPNRTPSRCGWKAAKGHQQTVIGNHYSTRFADSWMAAVELAGNLPELERRTRAFVDAIAGTSLPGAVKDAAMSNLSTLATTTSFRTADGEFHGFEGVNDKVGSCYGSCTHVWNYETATAFLFPTLARSLRRAAFGHPMDERGAMHFREVLPAGLERSSVVAADGQFGQIMKLYLDWRLSGDPVWLKEMYPKARKALEFAWVQGGWDADQDGVAEGVQHNTYDVEFYGPNPQCGIYYLGALRAVEELARAAGDAAFAGRCRALYERGSRWIDAHLFNGEYYIQEVRGVKKDQVAAGLTSDMGSENTEKPDYQVGAGCLVDQLVGQYQAEVCGLGPLLDPARLRAALASIHRYNHRATMEAHPSVQRTFALNDEAALVICDYGKAARPHIPFPYFAEVMTGFEYTAATQMLYAGMLTEGIGSIEDIRRRYDGERRNPWDEAECGHHYARAMAAWTAVLALCGFDYDAPTGRLAVNPRLKAAPFRGFWSTASGWGTFELGERLTVRAEAGELRISELAVRGIRHALAAPVVVRPGQSFIGKAVAG
jgi:uncharacterized protein (DUF608 family)